MHSSADKMLKIAKVLKSNGTEGEVIISFLGISPEDIDMEEPVFIYFDGLPVPFYFESFIRKGTNKAAVKLTGIRNLEDADEIAGTGIFAREESLDIEYDEDDFSFLEGWTLYDIHHTPDTKHHQDDNGRASAGTGMSGGSDPDNDAPGKGRTENQGDDAPGKGQTGNQDRRGHGNRIPENHCTENLTEIGEITGFLDIPGNPCIEVSTQNGPVTIPLHEDLIVSIDPDTETIVMDIPAGLL